ncbi:MAG: alpha/beta hydrolase [Pseudomonadota bacterium]
MSVMAEAKPPSLFWTFTEGRAVLELGAFGVFRNAMKNLPEGDGHSVLVLPGFMAGDMSTRPMRRLLNDIGYDTHGWGLGRNVRFNEQREADMISVFTDLYRKSGQKISIVGWSLGGVFARELAKMQPDMVRCVISLGSPISNDRKISRARHLFEAINGRRTTPEQEGRYARLHEAPPVPTTSIFTKADGVVDWRGSVQEEGEQTENIHVPGSHVGLGVNPLVMVAIADRLAQDDGEWTPFERSGWRDLFFGGI